MPDASPCVTYACAGQVASLILNRPETLNSLDLPTVDALIESLARAVQDRAAVLLLSGNGRAFCSGADLSGVIDQRDAEGCVDIGTPLRSHYNALALALHRLPMPLVVAVNGVAAGGGASLALHGDIVVAARSASFRQTFVDIGLMPDMGASWLVPRLAGRARARGMALLGQPVSAAKALEWGLIWDVVDDAQLMASAHDIAARLAALPREALLKTRQALDIGAHADFTAQLELEARMQAELGRQAAFTQAVAAFLARRRSATDTAGGACTQQRGEHQ